MPIHILPEEVASQIAAGEVVERPASVVKELIENALDAQAHQIVVRVESAGRRLIEVSDDGNGIPQEELALAVMRHATSKLHTAEDLFRIATLGFRGEALASIASVSHFSLVSRPPQQTTAARIRVDGGKVGAVEMVGAPVGTLVRVEDLFFNVPARLKFLKRDQTERQQIDALVTRYALAYPHVRFQLFHDGTPVFQTAGNGHRREVLAQMYDIDISRQMLEVEYEDDMVSVSGFTSPVGLTRSNRKEITIFVNGRWVQDTALNTALLQAYHTMLMVGRYPMAILFVSLHPEEVDVNVHPTKAEVRFRNPDRVFSAVSRAVRRALLTANPVPSVVPPSVWQRPVTGQSTIDPAWEMSRQAQGTWFSSETTAEEPESPVLENPSHHVQSPLPSGMLPLLRLVGQVAMAYLVAEGPDGLYLIDQHAAHERVLFERFLQRKPDGIPAQTLLEPVLVHLSPAQARLLENELETLNRIGFQIEPFGPATFRVTAIPVILAGADPVSAVRAVVEDFEEDETPLQSEVEARLIARICKRTAVKAGQVLSPEEQRALLHDLEACQSPRTCPHGRPTMIHLSADLLERQFGRKGSR